MKSETIYPHRRSYLLKLHSEAAPDLLAGRLHNLCTGGRREFASSHELLQSIAGDLAAADLVATADAAGKTTERGT